MNSQTTKKLGVVHVYPSERERSRTNAKYADVGVATESPVVIDDDGDDNQNYIADVEDFEEGFAGEDKEQLETATASARKVFTTWTDILQQVAEEQRDEVLLSSSVVADGGAFRKSQRNYYINKSRHKPNLELCDKCGQYSQTRHSKSHVNSAAVASLSMARLRAMNLATCGWLVV
ncbi:hypothetical protein PsorP6_001933 [Peronosclerospora sorghi]|uniref:Uncharacterized protein n=1 Tax=Peronosclerospora sorghi TaxID=230839 RepID=A0ACC0WQY4_9STRA|nr:hypothetical protein PsorP6_001933 [Peronosclerospora sorghi]